MDRPPCPFHR